MSEIKKKETYLMKSKLFNTGFLINDSESRIKQGLDPQFLSNNVNYKYLEKKDNLLENNYYNNPLFPLKMPYVSYGTPSVPNDCECLRNMHSPDEYSFLR